MRVKAIAPLRRLPDDTELQRDEEACDIHWGEHSQSWILSDEILASARPVSVGGDEPGSVVAEFCTEVQRLHELYGTLRMIQGFNG
ncbi:hypothetical protein DL738_11540 [Escherichia coli]|nr:hypothetical protein [Escherichia coli]